MKRIPVFAMLLAPYLMGLFFVLQNANLQNLMYGFLLFIALLVVGAVNALWMPRDGATGRDILFWNMILKICHLPFYAIAFLMVVAIMPEAPSVLPIVGFICYIVLCCTAVYGVNGLLRCRREGTIPSTTAIVLMVSQFIFFLDAICAIAAYVLARKGEA